MLVTKNHFNPHTWANRTQDNKILTHPSCLGDFSASVEVCSLGLHLFTLFNYNRNIRWADEMVTQNQFHEKIIQILTCHRNTKEE